MQELLRLRDQGDLNEYQMQWFRESKDKEELFDCENDPHELNNLAQDPSYAEKLLELGTEMDRWLTEIGDQPDLPEAELIDQLWQGSETKPVTAHPEIKIGNGLATITCSTEGASIGYRIRNPDGSVPVSWSVYTEPLEVPETGSIMVQAHRIGYLPSEVQEINPL
jgi:hypothetical protein